MKTNKELDQVISDTLEALSQWKDDGRKEFAIISYPTQLQVLGVRNPDLKVVIKELRTQTKSWAQPDQLLLAKKFIETGIMECVQLAFEYLGLDKKLLATLSEKDLPALTLYMDNWVCIDTFGVHVLGILWRNGQISDQTIINMAHSKDFWFRRLTLVATIPFNMKSRGGNGNTEKTLMVCELLVADKHDMLVKALSWALRELLPHDKEAVEAFINKHDAVIHARVKRELKNKMTTGKKN